MPNSPLTPPGNSLPGSSPSGNPLEKPTLLPRRNTTREPSTGGSLSLGSANAESMQGVSTVAVRDSAQRSAYPPRAGRHKGVLSKRDLLMVVTQLSIMLRSGVDLAEAVRSISNRSGSVPIRTAMGEVYAALENGSRLSRALESQRQRFGGVTVASVAAGEAAGRLPDVLTRLSTIIRDELRLQSTIRSAVSYPLVLTCVTSLVLAAMIFFVLPQFGSIYATSRAPTPAITQLMLDGAELARSYWWLLFASGAGGGFALYRYLRSPGGRRHVDRLLLRLPIARKICTSLMAGRMFRLQGAMLDSDVPMLEVLQLTRDSVGNSCFAELVDSIEASVVNGEGFGDALHESVCVPDGAAEMVATAEANGQLGVVLQTVGEFYESEGEQHLRDAVKIVEPAIIVGLGLIVGVIVLAVMLPLLDLSTAGAM